MEAGMAQWWGERVGCRAVGRQGPAWVPLTSSLTDVSHAPAYWSYRGEIDITARYSRDNLF